MKLLSEQIKVLEGTDVDAAWDRFEVFEALHHTMSICNPMVSAEVDELVDALELEDGDTVFDVACGYGEMLFRCGERASVSATGIDLSPWMISRAHEQSAHRAPTSEFRWLLGEARDYMPAPKPRVALCIGAEWVWHDFKGTARALGGRVPRGGVVAIGAARLHLGADPAVVRAQRGQVDTVEDQRVMLEEFGLMPFHRVDPDDDGWDAYLARTAQAASRWAEQNPGPRAQQWLEEQADWQHARERDREVIGWSVWMAKKAETIT